MGEFVREISAMPEARALERLRDRHQLDALAGENLLRYLAEQRAATGVLPTDRTIVVERFRDEIGDWRLCVLSPFGGQVHAPWALALGAQLRAEHGVDTQALWSDDGIILHLPDADDPPPGDAVALDPDAVEDLIVRELGDSALYAARFRENAARALLIPRRRPGQRTPLWQQRLKAQSLLAAAEGFGSFPVVLETYREVLQDVLDVPGLVELLRALQRREVGAGRGRDAVRLAVRLLAALRLRRAVHVRVRRAPAERRAQALSLDRGVLRELLGQEELGDLLDPEARAEVGSRRSAARTAAGPRRWPTCCGGSATSAPEEVDDPEASAPGSCARGAPPRPHRAGRSA